MEIHEENGVLRLMIEGRIDSGNASEFEQNVINALEAHPGIEPVFDSSRLEYISSAGLRVLMKARKTAKKQLRIVNVSPEVYEIFEVTGFSSLFDIEKRMREVSVEGCEVIGRGANGKVYRLDDDKIVKVYNTLGSEVVKKEQEFARTALINGIPSVIPYDAVRCGDKYGVVFEMLHSDTLGHALRDNPERMNELVDQYVALAKTLHSTHIPKGGIPDVRDLLRERAAKLGKWCSDEEIRVLSEIIDAMPECDTVIHNDLHPGNIMIQDGELVLIDLAEVTVGPKAFDLAAIFRDMIAGARTDVKVTEMTIGMPVDMVEQVAQLFFVKYTGITDPNKLKEYFDSLGLLFAFNTVLLVGSGIADTASYAPRIMDNLLRPVVIPNKDAIPNLLSTM